MEPKYPGLVERYVNLGDCYDRAGLQPLRQELMGCMKGYKACYQRAYRCLTAAAQIGEDLRSLLLTPALEAKMAKRARGILSREVKKGDGEAGRAVQRFLGGVTWKGVLCQFETVDALCKRVYELADTYGLAHSMLTHLAAGALASGHDVIVCPSPLFPDRMEHLLIPSLSLAFVSASPSLPYPKRPYRRIRLDAMADAELLRRNKARLKFSRRGLPGPGQSHARRAGGPLQPPRGLRPGLPDGPGHHRRAHRPPVTKRRGCRGCGSLSCCLG